MALLIPDSGPLFSLAAGGLLEVLVNFRIAITDVVKAETIDAGQRAGASSEAELIAAFYARHAERIEIHETQVGRDLAALQLIHPDRRTPANMGELSIQSLLIKWRTIGEARTPLILFEDSWFLRNAQALTKPYQAISTQAFLINLERLGLIASASESREAIAKLRPTAYAGEFSAKGSREKPPSAHRRKRG